MNLEETACRRSKRLKNKETTNYKAMFSILLLPWQINPFAFSSASHDEARTLSEVKKWKDYPDFFTAMQSEIVNHTENEHWEIVGRD